MPRLTEMTKGSRCIFIRLHGGGSRRMQRLADMGMLPGEPLQVVHNHGQGPVTIYVKGSRIALGHMMSQAIEVEDINNGRK